MTKFEDFLIEKKDEKQKRLELEEQVRNENYQQFFLPGLFLSYDIYIVEFTNE